MVEELKEFADSSGKRVKAPNGFIVLTAVDGAINNIKKITIRVEDILFICSGDDGSRIHLKAHDGSRIHLKAHDDYIIFVRETIEEILGKIADMKGE